MGSNLLMETLTSLHHQWDRYLIFNFLSFLFICHQQDCKVKMLLQELN